MSAVNGVMMQYFHWYLPANGSLWTELTGSLACPHQTDNS